MFKKLLATIMTALLISVPTWAFDEKAGKFEEFGFAPDRYIDLSQSVVSVVTMGTAIGIHPYLGSDGLYRRTHCHN